MISLRQRSFSPRHVAGLIIAMILGVWADSLARADEAFALIGTANYPGGSFAIFDGTDGSLREIVHPGEKIADYTLSRVMDDRVILLGSDGRVELPMDKQLRRDETGQWQLVALTGRLSPREEAPRVESERPNPPPVSAPIVAQEAVRREKGASSGDGSAKLEKELEKLDKKLMGSAKPEKELRKIESDGAKKILKSMSKEFRKSS